MNSLADPGAATCDATQCTLRAAISAAAGAGGVKIIEFEEALSGTITLGSELFINFNGLTIEGPGPDVISLSGNDTTRIFRFFGSDAVIRGLTIQDGNSEGASPNSNGGGIYISNGGNVQLENLRIINNSNAGQGAAAFVFFAAATIRNIEISGNTGALGALLVNGGSGHHVLIENVTFSGNVGNQSASALVVLTNAGQNVTIRYITVVNNSGSPLAASVSGTAGQTTIDASIFADNDSISGDLSDTSANGTVNNSIIKQPTGSYNGSNNLLEVDPQLGSLQYVDGSIQRVHPPGEGPARNHVNNSIGNPGCGTLVTQDQVGNPRPSGTRCDAGAYEVQDTFFADRFEQTVF